jgi:ureidoacrylate peracid hydrolase
MQSVKIGSHPTNRWNLRASGVDLSRDEPSRIRKITVAAEPQNITIDLHRTAIIVVDMQNDFCAAGGYLDRCGVDCGPARKLITPINALLQKVRPCKVPVVWLNWSVRSDRLNISPSMPHLHVNADKLTEVNHQFMLEKGGWGALEGTWGAQIIDGLETSEDDIHVQKQRFSGFFNTDLDSILRNMNVTTLFFAGVASDICVLTTLQDAMFLGYDVVMMADCVATNSPHYCVEATEHHVKQLYGFMSSSEALIAGIV